MKPWWLAVLLCGLGMAVEAETVAPQEVDPPLGLHWSETQKDVEATNPPVTERAVMKDQDTWTLEGFTQVGLKRAILYFSKAKTLDEVELQYEEPTWSFDDYQAFFGSARDSLRQQYGDPIVLARYKEPNHEQNVVETLVDLLWRSEGGSIQLVFYAAERDTNTWRMISLNYRSEAATMNADVGNNAEKSEPPPQTDRKEVPPMIPEASPDSSPTPTAPKPHPLVMRRPVGPRSSPSPTPTPNAEQRRQMKEQALKALADEQLKDQNALKEQKKEIDQQIKTTTGAVREQWKYKLAKWQLTKAQADADEQAKKKAVEDKFK
jgi:hypothetical protein